MHNEAKGMSLVEILIAVALMGTLATTYFAFFRNASKSAGDLVKVADTTGVDAGIRNLLTNAQSCLETVKNIPSFGTTTTETRPVDVRAWFASGALAPPAFQEGKVYNSTRILELGATVSERVRDVHLVRFRVKTEKVGESMNRKEYEYFYYVNVVTNVGGVPVRCMPSEESQSSLTLVNVEDVELKASNVTPTAPYTFMRTSAGFPTSSFGAPGWEPITLPSLAGMTDCSATESCPFYSAVAKTIRTKGNLLVYSFSTKISMGLNSPGSPQAFGGIVGVVLKDPYNTTKRHTQIKVSGWFGEPGFRQSSITIPVQYAEVEPDKDYTLRLIFAGGEEPPVGTGYFINWFPAQGTVYHYMQNSPFP